MVYYNTSFVGELTGVGSMITGINNMVGGLLGIFLIVLIIGFATMIASSRYDDFRLGSVIGTFVGSIFSGLVWFVGAIPFWIAMIPFILFIMTLLANVVWKRDR